MPPDRFSNEDLSRLGMEIYKKLRPIVETEDNIGKIISIDVASGDYAIADDPFDASAQIRSRHSDPDILGLRIGYDAMYAVGGSLTRTAKP